MGGYSLESISIALEGVLGTYCICGGCIFIDAQWLIDTRPRVWSGGGGALHGNRCSAPRLGIDYFIDSLLFSIGWVERGIGGGPHVVNRGGARGEARGLGDRGWGRQRMLQGDIFVQDLLPHYLTHSLLWLSGDF